MDIPRRKSKLYRIEDCEEKMHLAFHQGKVKGSTTHIPDIDKCWTWRLQEMNIWTGYMNEGKSIFIRFLTLIKALMDGWRFLFAAPEDFPPEEFYDDLIHTLVGLPTDRDNSHRMDEDWYIRALAILKDRIFFVYMEPGSTIADTLNEFRHHIRELGNIQGCVIDPLIKFARPKDMSDRDDIYAAHITAIGTDFCRQTNVSFHMVLHQLTPRNLENGFYAKPTAYNIKGGGTWTDGVDNVMFVWRPFYAKDKLDSSVIFGSSKIKKQKLVGVPQEIEMRFDRRSNRYVSHSGGHDLFDFDSLFQRLMK